VRKERALERRSRRGRKKKKPDKERKKNFVFMGRDAVAFRQNRCPMLPPASDQEYKKESMQCNARIGSQTSEMRKTKQKRIDLKELKRSQRRFNKEKQQQIV
jgi:hypothetical protein